MLLLLHVLYVVHVSQRLITVQIGFLPVRTRHLPAPEGSAIFVMSYEKENFHHIHNERLEEFLSDRYRKTAFPIVNLAIVR